MTPQASLRAALRGPAIVPAPGVFDALGAMLAEAAGFSALYVSGASIAYTRLGRPDIGLVAMTEVAETVGLIRERVALPLIVDADTGFGNALNVQRTVRLLERSGASAIQIEDQVMPKRCGHLSGKALIGSAEMVGKIRAACDARRSDDTLLIARTDAIAVEGFEAALERAGRFAEAGADVLFVEAPQSEAQVEAIAAALGGRAALMANMVEGGRTPIRPAAELEALGYDLVIFPGGLVRTLARATAQFMATLKADGSTLAMTDTMLDFDGLNRLLQTDRLLAAGRRYDEDA